MGGIVAAMIGLPVAAFAFLVMRNPMRRPFSNRGKKAAASVLFCIPPRGTLLEPGLIGLLGAGAREGFGGIFKGAIFRSRVNGLMDLGGADVGSPRVLWCRVSDRGCSEGKTC